MYKCLEGDGESSGSLVVSGGSLIDRMSLINTNATALQAVCTRPHRPPVDYATLLHHFVHSARARGRRGGRCARRARLKPANKMVKIVS